MSFDEIIERRGSHCNKWDKMEATYGVSAEDGIAMWVADMDFRPPQVVLDRARALVDHGVFGYTTGNSGYYDAVAWWMSNRHGWQVDPSWLFTTTGLVNAVGLCLDTYTAPGDGIVLFTPVYHAFARVIRGAGRVVVECPMVLENGRYRMDFAASDALMTGSETMLILCSPHNPGGCVWTREELQGVADFARRHDLVLVSDEIHHDLVYPGHKHIPTAVADPGVTDRLVTLTAPSKTFNLAGLHTGNVIIEDAELRKKFAARMTALSLASNVFGVEMATAAYSPEGAAWVDALTAYLNGNRQLFDTAIDAIPGLASVPLDATYLAWVDFSGTGMTRTEFTRRVEQDARIAVNHGTTFGTGGENFLRFNFATPRARVQEACYRLTAAFSDLQ